MALFVVARSHVDTLFICSFLLYVLHQFLISNAKLFGTRVERNKNNKIDSLNPSLVLG